MSNVYFSLMFDRFMRSPCLQTPLHFTRFVSKAVQESDIDYYLHKAAIEGAKPKRRRPITTSIGKKRTTVDFNDEHAKSGKRRRVGSACTANHIDPWVMDSTSENNFGKERLGHAVKLARSNLHQGSTQVTPLESNTLATATEESQSKTIEKVKVLPEQSKHETTKHSGRDNDFQQNVTTSPDNTQVDTKVVLAQVEFKDEAIAIPEQILKSSDHESDSSPESDNANHALPKASSAENEGDSGFFEGESEHDNSSYVSQSQPEQTNDSSTKEEVSAPPLEIAQNVDNLDAPDVNTPQEQNGHKSSAEDLNAGDGLARSESIAISHNPTITSSEIDMASSQLVVSTADSYTEILEQQFKVEDVTEWTQTLLSKAVKSEEGSKLTTLSIKKSRKQRRRAPAIYTGKRKRVDEIKEVDGRGVYVENKKRICYGFEQDEQIPDLPTPSVTNSNTVAAPNSAPNLENTTSFEIEMEYNNAASPNNDAVEASLDNPMNMDIEIEDGNMQDDVVPIDNGDQINIDDFIIADVDMLEDDTFEVQDWGDDLQEMTDVAADMADDPMADDPMADVPASQYEEMIYSHSALTFSEEAQVYAAPQSFAQNKVVEAYSIEADMPDVAVHLEHNIVPTTANRFTNSDPFNEPYISYAPVAPYYPTQTGHAAEEQIQTPYAEHDAPSSGNSIVAASFGVERIAPPTSPIFAKPYNIAGLPGKAVPSAATKHKHGRADVSSGKRTKRSGGIQKVAQKPNPRLLALQTAKWQKEVAKIERRLNDTDALINQQEKVVEKIEALENEREGWDFDTKAAYASSTAAPTTDNLRCAGFQTLSAASNDASNIAGSSSVALPSQRQMSVTSLVQTGSRDSAAVMAAHTQSDTIRSSEDAVAAANAPPTPQPCDTAMQTLQRTELEAETQASVAVPAPAQLSVSQSAGKTMGKQPQSASKSPQRRSNKKMIESRREHKIVHGKSSKVEKRTKSKRSPPAFSTPLVFRTVGGVPGPAVAAATVSSTSAQLAPGPQPTPNRAPKADDGFISLESTDPDDLAGALQFGSSVNNYTDTICDLQGISNRNRCPRRGDDSSRDREEEGERGDGGFSLGEGAAQPAQIAPVSEDLEIAEQADDEGSDSEDSDEDEPGEDRIILIAFDRVVLSKGVMAQARAWAEETRTDPIEWKRQVNDLGVTIHHPVEIPIKLKAYAIQWLEGLEERRAEQAIIQLSLQLRKFADLNRPPTDLDGREIKPQETEERSTNSKPIEPAARKMDIDENYDDEFEDENLAMDTSRNAPISNDPGKPEGDEQTGHNNCDAGEPEMGENAIKYGADGDEDESEADDDDDQMDAAGESDSAPEDATAGDDVADNKPPPDNRVPFSFQLRFGQPGGFTATNHYPKSLTPAFQRGSTRRPVLPPEQEALRRDAVFRALEELDVDTKPQHPLPVTAGEGGFVDDEEEL